MEPLDLTSPPSPVLVVVAHPDDIDFGMAGTIATLTRAGGKVVYGLVTSGEAGEPEGVSRREVAELRQAEQRAAAAEVGVDDVRFLGHPDGRVIADLSLRRDISRLIRAVKPALVITQSPERRWDRIYASHPDHLAVAEATMAAVYPDSRNPHAHLDLLDAGYAPHVVPEVWVGGLEPVDVIVDITDVFEVKVAALRQHVSQNPERFDVPKMLGEWAASLAATAGMPDGRLVEAFRRVNTA